MENDDTLDRKSTSSTMIPNDPKGMSFQRSEKALVFTDEKSWLWVIGIYRSFDRR